MVEPIITVHDLTPEEAESVILRKHDYPDPSPTEPAHRHLLNIKNLGWNVATLSDQREIMHYINHLECTPLLLEEALSAYVHKHPDFNNIPYNRAELKRQISLICLVGYKKSNLPLINRKILEEGLAQKDTTPAELQKALNIAQRLKNIYSEMNREIIRNREILEGKREL